MLSPSVTQTWRLIKPLRRMPQWYFSAAHRREKNCSTQGGHQPKLLTHGALAPGVCLIHGHRLWIQSKITACGSRIRKSKLLVDAEEMGKRGQKETWEIVSRHSSKHPSIVPTPYDSVVTRI